MLVIAFPVVLLCQFLQEPGAVVAFVYLAATMLIGLPVLFWPCPRCGRWYSMRFWPIAISWPWVDHCLHCDSALQKDDSPEST